MIAAAGNAGPKSPPLYPAANPNVIAVSATDAHDRLFAASNRGGHIALAAPGVDIFLPAPDGKYQMTSGTSFSAAYVSGLAALMMERNPAAEAGRGARNPDEDRARPRCARPGRFVRRRRGRCLRCGHRGAGRRGAGGRRAGPAACRKASRNRNDVSVSNAGFGPGHGRRWHRKSRPKISVSRPKNRLPKKLKKSRAVLNVRRSAATNTGGSGNPSP